MLEHCSGCIKIARFASLPMFVQYYAASFTNYGQSSFFKQVTELFFVIDEVIDTQLEEYLWRLLLLNSFQI